MGIDATPTEEGSASGDPQSNLQGERILIVDDDPQVRALLVRFLKKEGAIPLEASGAKEALTLVRCEQPAVVLLDVRLPDANGLEFLTTQLQPELGPYRVIVITGDGNQKDALTAALHGAYDYVLKPVPLAKLKLALRNCLELHRLTRELTESSGGLASPVALRDLVGTSPQIQQVIAQVKQLAPYDVPVMILGENGTGKELVSRAIHTLSARRKGPWVPIDAGALPEGLVEGELFGHERGAFSGAVATKPGRLEQAQEGPSCLMKSATFRRRSRPTCSACSSRGRWIGWADSRRSRWMSACSRRPTRMWSRWSRPGAFAGISIIASTR